MRSVTIVSGGLGSRSGMKAACALTKSYQQVGRICSLDYGSRILPEQNAQLVMDFVDEYDIEEVNYDAESMGLITTAAMFPYFRGHRAAEITNRIVADCSPVCEDDVRNKDIDTNFLLFDTVEAFGGFGFAGKFLSQLWSNMRILNQVTFKDVTQQLFNAWDRGMESCLLARPRHTTNCNCKR